MTTELRPISALNRVGECPDPGKAPDVLILTLDQLRINDEYQRSMTESSKSGVRKMAKAWDWNRYTPISVAKTDKKGIFEVTDGQRRALAAACNGNVHLLPAYLTTAKSLEEKAASFVGVNTGRKGLTPAEIYKGNVAAGHAVANEVQKALDAAGVRLLSMPQTGNKFQIGDTMAVGTLMQIAAKAGGDRLTVLLRVAKAAEGAPVSSGVLKALDLALPYGAGFDDKHVQSVLKVLTAQGAYRLEAIAKKMTPEGKRSYDILADQLATMARLPGKRLGLKSYGKDSRVTARHQKPLQKRGLRLVAGTAARTKKAA